MCEDLGVDTQGNSVTGRQTLRSLIEDTLDRYLRTFSEQRSKMFS